MDFPNELLAATCDGVRRQIDDVISLRVKYPAEFSATDNVNLQSYASQLDEAAKQVEELLRQRAARETA